MSARASLAATFALAALALAPRAAPADGEPDLDFGGGDGIAAWEAFGPVLPAALAASDERLFALGRYHFAGGGPHLHWWSVDPAGELDVDHFCEGETGDLLPLSLGVTSRLTSGLVDSSGRLLAGGALAMLASEEQERPLLVRFLPSEPGCALDTAFTSNGWEIFDGESWCDAEDCEVLGLVELTPATGAVLTPRYVALVRAAAGGFGASRLFLLRLTPAGNPDTGFGGDGWVEIADPALSTLFAPAALAVDPRGRLYVALTHSDPTAPLDLDLHVARYTPDGSLDPTFGTGGLLPVSDDGPDDAVDMLAYRIAVSAEGALFVSMRRTSPPPASPLLFVRSADGARSGYLGESATGPMSLVLQGDRRLVIAQDRDSVVADNFRAYRVRTSPPEWMISDLTFGGGDGFVDYDVDLGGGDAEAVSAVVLWHGRIVYGGSASMVGSTGGFLLRAENAYVFADGFEGGTPALWSSVLGFGAIP